jgi:hypothetical protein
MASIVENKKYGEGHQVILKDKISGSMALKLRQFNYTPGKDIFKITLKSTPKPNRVIDLVKGNKSVLLLDKANRKILMTGTESAINGLFNHFTTNAKAKTNLLTEIKETFSLEVFKGMIENGKTFNEEQLIKMVEQKVRGTANNYDSTYYTSAYKQVKELKKYIKKKGYTYERQGGPITKDLYTVARKLTGKLSDNWNPADVWMVQRNFNMKPILNSKSASQLNSQLTQAFNKRKIIPISLKQVEGTTAKSSIIDPSNLMKQKLDLDLSFDRVDLSDSFNNFIVITKSGFAIRCGFKASATTLNVSLEGRFIGAGFQTGAVDAKVYTNEVSEKHSYSLRSGSVVTNQYDVAKRELKQMFNKYGRLSNSDDLKNYNDAIKLFNKGDKLTKDRFTNLMSYMYSFLIKPRDFKEHMKFCYFTSKKLTTDSGIYLILQ